MSLKQWRASNLFVTIASGSYVHAIVSRVTLQLMWEKEKRVPCCREENHNAEDDSKVSTSVGCRLETLLLVKEKAISADGCVA